jgi:tubulin epsilon
MKFWETVLKEQSKYRKDSKYTEALSVFFQNQERPSLLCSPNQTPEITALRARAVIIDMEEGVINQINKSPISSLFQSN